MKKVYLISLLLFVSMMFCVSADDFATYQKLLQNRDYKVLEKHLQKWERAEPKSAEVYVAYFNMYLSMGMESRNVISKEPPKDGDVLELHDEKTGKCVGYMGSEIFYKYEEVQKAIAALDKGLKYNPKRLDMYFGKAHVLGEIGKYKEQSKVIIKVLDLSVKYKNNWLWSFDKPFEGSGSLHISELRLLGSKSLVSPKAPIEIGLGNGRLDFSSVSFLPINDSLSLSGYIDAKGWNAVLKGHSNLAYFAVFIPELEHIEGNFDTRLFVSGDILAPVINGEIELQSGAMSVVLDKALLELRKLNFKARFVDSDLFIDNLVGKIGPGNIVAKLNAKELFNAPKRSLDIVGGLSNVILNPMEELSVGVEGEVSYRYLANVSHQIVGDIRVRSLFYENNLSLRRVLRYLTKYLEKDIASSSSSSFSVERNKGVQCPKLDLHVSAENNMIVDTSFAKAEMRGELTVKGTTLTPLLNGKISVIEGDYGFQSTSFKILKGDIVFVDKVQQREPKLDFLSEGIVSDNNSNEYHIQMFIGGTLSKPEVGFSSDAGLDQNQIVQVLSKGVSTISSSAGRSYKDSVFNMLSVSSNTSLEERLQGLAGFSELSIAPSVSASTGEITPKVIAVRPLLNNIDLQLKTELSHEPESEAIIKYHFTPYLQLITGWKNKSITESVDSSTGAWLLGVGFKKSFPGTNLLP